MEWDCDEEFDQNDFDEGIVKKSDCAEDVRVIAMKLIKWFWWSEYD